MMMNDVLEVTALLCQKRTLFLEIEDLTNQMSTLPVDDLINVVAKRAELLAQVKTIDDSITEHCKDNALLRNALNHDNIAQNLPQELKQISHDSLSIKAIVNRIKNSEEYITMYLETEKTRIVKKIEELNHSGSVVANRYHRSIETAQNKPLTIKRGQTI